MHCPSRPVSQRALEEGKRWLPRQQLGLAAVHRRRRNLRWARLANTLPLLQFNRWLPPGAIIGSLPTERRAPACLDLCVYGGGEVPPHEITKNLILGVRVLVVGVETEPRFGGQ